METPRSEPGMVISNSNKLRHYNINNVLFFPDEELLDVMVTGEIQREGH